MIRCLKACTSMLLLGLLILPFCGGCTSEDEDTVISTTTEGSVAIALDTWASKGSRQEATLAAQQIVLNANAILADLNGNTAPLGPAIQKTLSVDLIKGLDSSLASAVLLASNVLTRFIPDIPTQALSGTQVGYIKAFLNGCIDGANNSMVGPPFTAGTAKVSLVKKTKSKKSVWIVPESELVNPKATCKDGKCKTCPK